MSTAAVASISEPMPIQRPFITVADALEELERKYTSPPTDLVPGIQFLSSSPPKGQCLKRLRHIVLSNSGIASVGDARQIAENLRNAHEIDLSRNNVRKWEIVGELLTAVPSLKCLDLSFNPLRSFLEHGILDEHRLEHLALNGVSLPFATLRYVLQKFPRLKTLQICGVELEAPENKENHSTDVLSHSLTDLHMENCSLFSWSQCLLYAARFPSLEHLRVSGNPLNSVFAQCPETGVQMSQAMSTVRSLALNCCAIDDWSSVEALAHLPALEDLRLRDVPLLAHFDCDMKHQLIIPRLPQLKVLNGSQISSRYREDCERSFIRYYQNQTDKPSCFEALVDIHGQLEPLVSVDFTPQETVRTRLRCDEKNLNCIMKHRLHVTVRSFLKSLCKPTNIPLDCIRVLHITPQYPTRGPVELRPSNQFLHTLKVEDGDEFHVFTKIVPSGVSHL